MLRFKCEKCGAILFTGRFVGDIRVKCPECGHINEFKRGEYLSLPESKKDKLIHGAMAKLKLASV